MERHPRRKDDVVCVDGLRMLAEATFFDNQVHDGAHELCGREDLRLDHGFLRVFDEVCVRHVERVVHLQHRAVLEIDVVFDAWVCEDQVHSVVPSEPFLDDVHVEQSEEAAPESRPQGD